MNSRSIDLLVVGGGLAGLVAAAHAARAGLRVRLLEAADELGGRARTRVFDGFSVNLGPRALFRGAAHATLVELGVAFSGRRPPSTGLAILEDRFHALPAGPLSVLMTSLVDASGKVEISRFMAWLARAHIAELEARRFGDVLDARVRHPVVRALVRSLTRVCTYDAEPDDLCAAAATIQMRSAVRDGVLYLDGGWTTLVEGLASAARGAGATVDTGMRVASIERTSSSAFRARTEQGEIEATAVVLAVQPSVAARLFPSLAPAATRCTPLRVACLDVALASVPHPKRRFALGLDAPLYYSLHSASARLAPDGAGVAHLMRYGDGAPETQAELRVLLERMQPGARLVDVRYLPAMIAANARVTAASGGLGGRPPVDAEPGVFLAGDWVGDEGMLADAACASARKAAELAARHLRSARERAA